MIRTTCVLGAVLTLCAIGPPAGGQSASSEVALADDVGSLVRQLDANSSAERRAAERALYELATETGGDAQAVLDALPMVNDRMPAAVRSGIGRIRRRIEKTLAERAAEATRVTLTVKDTPLTEVLKQIGEQTGNQLSDSRSQFGNADASQKVSIELQDEPFWPAIDRLLDAANLGVYAYGGDYELSLVAREPGVRPRFGGAAYAGPYRIEPLRVVSTRGLRTTGEASLDVEVEVAWEPRLQPIAVSQPMSDLTAKVDGGATLSVLRPEQSIDVEVTPGTQGVEMTLSFVLPERATEQITTINGRLETVIPGRQTDFRFEAIGAESRPRGQQQGDATVSLERFTKSGPIWELHMRLTMANAGDAFASHRGWVFQNLSYLTDADGARIEHAGFETVLQTANEVGLVYLFDLRDMEASAADAIEGAEADPRRLAWVYRSPVSIVSLRVEYELKDIQLP
ncbi:MAG: hypothetical protein AAFV43_02980 [Planctomycetota bacterium]